MYQDQKKPTRAGHYLFMSIVAMPTKRWRFSHEIHHFHHSRTPWRRQVNALFPVNGGFGKHCCHILLRCFQTDRFANFWLSARCCCYEGICTKCERMRVRGKRFDFVHSGTKCVRRSLGWVTLQSLPRLSNVNLHGVFIYIRPRVFGGQFGHKGGCDKLFWWLKLGLGDTSGRSTLSLSSGTCCTQPKPVAFLMLNAFLIQDKLNQFYVNSLNKLIALLIVRYFELRDWKIYIIT